MNMNELAKRLELETVCPSASEADIETGYASDLLSDVMGNAAHGAVLVTIQAHKNTLAVASLKDMPGIIVCNNRQVPDDMAESARSEGIGIFRTRRNQFEVSGRMYSLLAR